MTNDLRRTQHTNYSWLERFADGPGEATLDGIPVALILDPTAFEHGKSGRIRFDSVLEVGREPPQEGAHILHLAQDPSVSRRHARITVRDRYFEITDLGSRNGTFVDGQRVYGSRHAAPGAMVSVGSHGLILKFLSDKQMRALHQEERRPFLATATRCGALAEMHARIEHLARAARPILLCGPPGAGKGHYAHAIHKKFRRRGRLVIIDCSAFAGLESSAVERQFRAMIPSRESESTLLLIEPQHIAVSCQERLLAMLGYGSTIGGSTSGPLGERPLLIATSSEPWLIADKSARSAGSSEIFEKLDIPPLSWHREDIASLVSQFVNPEFRLGSGVVRLLCCLSWPGNVRQLARIVNSAKRSALTRGSSEISFEDLPAELGGAQEAGHELGTGVAGGRGLLNDKEARDSYNDESLQQVVVRFSSRHQFSPRESQIMWLAARGQSDKEIAASLCCAYRTIRTHWDRIYRKADALDREEVLARLLRFAAGPLP